MRASIKESAERKYFSVVALNQYPQRRIWLPIVLMQNKAYAFWSPAAHRKSGGLTTATGIVELVYDDCRMDPEDISRVSVNWIGPCIGGYPGILLNGKLIRPADFGSYKLVTVVDDIENQPLREPRRYSRFWNADNALPERVFKLLGCSDAPAVASQQKRAASHPERPQKPNEARELMRLITAPN